MPKVVPLVVAGLAGVAAGRRLVRRRYDFRGRTVLVTSPDGRRYDAVRRACIMVDDFPHDIGRNAADAAANVMRFQDAVAARKTA